MSAECECSENYGPCEDHSEVLAQREGAALRTADELLAVFIGDAIDIIREEGVALDAAMVDGWEETAAAYWRVTDNAGGWAPLDGPPVGFGGTVFGDGTYGPAIRVCSETCEPVDLLQILSDEAKAVETYLPSDVYVWREDGYMISRITGGPLADEACTGQRYSVNPDNPGDGTDVRHRDPCPVHDEPVVPCGMCWRADVVYRETGGTDDNGDPWTAPYDPTTGEAHQCGGMSDR